MMKEVLYDDGLVKLDPDSLTIRRYYFRSQKLRHLGHAQMLFCSCFNAASFTHCYQ